VERSDRSRRLFFCRREAVETVIYLAEIRLAEKQTRFKPRTTEADLASLKDDPAEPGWPSLRRLGCEMATGIGKTVVMAMLTAWTLGNRGKFPGDIRFPAAVLVVCPNLTVKERLQVLRPDVAENSVAPRRAEVRAFAKFGAAEPPARSVTDGIPAGDLEDEFSGRAPLMPRDLERSCP
jgi:hypothetical protein